MPTRVPTDKPSPPRHLAVVEIYKDYVTVTWQVPESDGNSPITGYVVEKADAKRRTFTTSGKTDSDTLKFKVGQLYEGKEYLVRVMAENAMGQSEPVCLLEPVTARLPFGKLQ